MSAYDITAIRQWVVVVGKGRNWQGIVIFIECFGNSEIEDGIIQLDSVSDGEKLRGEVACWVLPYLGDHITEWERTKCVIRAEDRLLINIICRERYC